MLRIQSKASCLIVLALALAANVGASEGDTLITDPAMLARLGFPADARNVYVAAGVDLDRPVVRSATEEFGTVDVGYTTVPGNQHNPRESSTYASVGGDGDIYLVSGDVFYDALLEMPGGALWLGLSIWGFDDTAPDLLFFAISVCQVTPGPPVGTVLASSSTSQLGSNFLMSFNLPAGVTVNNEHCFYFVRTRFNAASSDLRLRKIQARWRRQVSPAPAVATFPNDVPVSHPYFRFVEALADAGITAGCLPNTYCVNNPITRGEMAVFLSVALGLHWP